jgi:ribosomal protein S27AE
MNTDFRKACPNCGSGELYTRRLDAGGATGVNLLKGLGSFNYAPKIEGVICGACGHCSYFAEHGVLDKLGPASGWEKIVHD